MDDDAVGRHGRGLGQRPGLRGQGRRGGPRPGRRWWPWAHNSTAARPVAAAGTRLGEASAGRRPSGEEDGGGRGQRRSTAAVGVPIHWSAAIGGQGGNAMAVQEVSAAGGQRRRLWVVDLRCMMICSICQ